MEANIYGDLVVVVKENGSVVLVTDDCNINIPVSAVNYIADASKFGVEVRKELANSNAEINRQRAIVNDLEGDNAKLTSALKNTANTVDAYKADYSKAKVRIASLEAELRELKAYNSKLKNNLEDGKKDHDGNVEPRIDIQGTIVKVDGVCLTTLDDEKICRCGTHRRAQRVADLLREGIVNLGMVKVIFDEERRI